MKAGRLPSSGITRSLRYYSPLRLLACRIRISFPYTEPLRPSPATNEFSRVTHNNFPHIPSRRPRRVHRWWSVLPPPMTAAFPFWQQGRHSRFTS